MSIQQQQAHPAALAPVAAVTDLPDGLIEVSPVWPGVDRPITHGFVVAKPALAQRLACAINAGVVYADPSIATDVNGHTYVRAECRVMGKYANADLKRLGF